jgi:hypothetical protein
VHFSDCSDWAAHGQFFWYNAVLRKFPKELYERIGSFTTTIFVLISAVQKIARVMKLPEGIKLYRGMGGLVDLPKAFFISDQQGRKGYVEWAFMSTTSDLEVSMRPCVSSLCMRREAAIVMSGVKACQQEAPRGRGRIEI